MVKRERNDVSKKCFILSGEHFVAKIWLWQFWADFDKKAFLHSRQLYTLTQDGVGGWGLVLNQHVWDGQGLKDPCFFVFWACVG